MTIFAIILLAASLLCAVALIYPYIIYPWLLKQLPEAPILFDDDAAPLTATLTFCAYNEARTLPEKLENLEAIRRMVPGIQFKAYVDLSTDGSAEILQARPDLIDVHVATERTGKALGMRRLAAASTTDIMIFTDANVMVEPASIARLLRYFSDPAVGGVCGTLTYINSGESATANVNSRYWRLEETLKNRESKSGSTMGADGSLFATRRSLYPRVPEHLLDDFIVSMSVVFQGYRLVSAPDVHAYEKSAAASADEFRRKRRIACRAYSSHRHIRPMARKMMCTNRFKYVSHRIVRWYGAAFGGASVLFGVLFMLMISPKLALAGVALALLLMALCRWSKYGLIASLSEILRALFATMLGVVDSWRGKRYQTWQPVQGR